MKKKVLVVDDDKLLISLLTKNFAKHEDAFTTFTAENGAAAIQLLKEHAISIVVTDLHMPKVDGFALLAHLSEHYPDIQVIIMTAYGKPKTEKIVRSRGAIGYFNKPFEADELSQAIVAALKKESEGGTLSNVTLEMFIQLIEMEAKTCTIRVLHKSGEKRGVLFFRDGGLLNARIDDQQGNEAAYEIFSWDSPTLSIENFCAQKKKNIEGDLQGILLEAMRLKDESAEKKAAEKKAGSPPPKPATAEPVVAKPVSKSEAPPAQAAKPLSYIEQIRKKLEGAMGQKTGVEDIYTDATWDDLITQVSIMGIFFHTGPLKACFVDVEKSNTYILLPGNDTTALVLNPKASRDRLLQILCE